MHMCLCVCFHAGEKFKHTAQQSMSANKLKTVNWSYIVVFTYKSELPLIIYILYKLIVKRLHGLTS